MKKLIFVASSLFLSALIMAIIFWMEDDQRMVTQIESIKKMERHEISNNLSRLLSIKKEEFPKYNNRVVIGETLKPLKKVPAKIELLNFVDPLWQEKTISYLNDSSDYDRKIQINKKESLIGLNKGVGLNLEQALISFIQRDGSRGSFEALINSETGAIELVISKNINENISEPAIQFKAPDSKNNPFANTATAEEMAQLNDRDIEQVINNLNQEKQDNLDVQQYEEEIAQQEYESAVKRSDQNFNKYVESIKREISSKAD